MQKLQILGTGCPKCKALEANARKAVAQAGLAIEIEKITDVDRIMDMGVMMTPALAFDGVVVSTGKILGSERIVALLGGEHV